HGLVSGTVVNIAGNPFVANGNYTITRIDADNFSLNGTSATGSGAGGTWTAQTSLAIAPGSPYTMDSQLPAGGTTPIGVALADTNQDGNLDVVTANRTGNDFSVFLGKGDGTLGVSTNINLTPTVTNDVAVADLNGDGLLDVAVISNNSNTNGSF